MPVVALTIPDHRLTLRPNDWPRRCIVLQVSRRVEYALRSTIFLANQPQGVLVSFREIAERECIPREFLAKILRGLAEAGIVQASRGTAGGFALARPANEITFLDVIVASDGPIQLNDACTAGLGCVRSGGCSMQSVWRQAETAMMTVFEQTRISDMAAPVAMLSTSAT